MMRKKQRHHRPKETNILVTILPKAAIRPVVEVHQRRWSVERLVEELRRATGVGGRIMSPRNLTAMYLIGEASHSA